MNQKTAFNVASLATVAVLIAALSGCAGMVPADSMSGQGYSRAETRQAQNVQFGTIQSIRLVQINGSTGTSSMVGTGVGAVMGGALGSLIGGGNGRTLAMALGAVGGGVAGNTIEKHVSAEVGDEITVGLDSGRVIAVTQKDEPGVFRRGDRVQVLSDAHGVSRVVLQ